MPRPNRGRVILMKQRELFEDGKPAGKHTRLLRQHTRPADYRPRVAAAIEAFMLPQHFKSKNQHKAIFGGHH